MSRHLAAAAALALLLPSMAHAAPGVRFLINGNTATQQFAFTNTSTNGERLVGFGFDLASVAGSSPRNLYFFDTAGSGATPLQAFGGSGATTGLTNTPIVPDEAQGFALSFNDFDVGETFEFRVDIDRTGNSVVFGDDLVGASVWFLFANNVRVEGSLKAVDDMPLASQFVTDRVIAGVPEPATWAMMLMGFGALGAVLRARRSLVPA